LPTNFEEHVRSQRYHVYVLYNVRHRVLCLVKGIGVEQIEPCV